MASRARIDGSALAIYQLPASGPADAPFTNPTAHLPLIDIHTGLDYLQVAVEFDITVHHPFVAKPDRGWDWSTWSFNWYPTAYMVDRLLGTHNLGLVPISIVANAQGVVEPGLPVQVNDAGGSRYIHIYLTDTQVRCLEVVDSGNADLAAISIPYKVFVLREPVRQPGVPSTEIRANRVRTGRRWFDSAYHYLRAVASGQSPYFIVGSQNVDTAGGICRSIDPLGNIRHDFYDAGRYTGGLGSVVARQVQR